MARIYLIRHGTTDLINKQLCGNLPGIHLNDAGRQMAQRTAAYLSKRPIQAIFSSPMERALETASPLAQALKMEVTPCEFLREINFGDYQGKGDELATDALWHQFHENPSLVQFPHGENVPEAMARVTGGLEKLAGQFGSHEELACFAHCEIIRLAVCSCLGLSPDRIHRLIINPACVSLVEWSTESRKLHLLNFSPE